MQKITRCAGPKSAERGSSITRWKRPDTSSSIVLCAAGSRSMLLGVITISGLRCVRFRCRRIMWKTCADVVGAQISMLSSELS